MQKMHVNLDDCNLLETFLVEDWSLADDSETVSYENFYGDPLSLVASPGKHKANKKFEDYAAEVQLFVSENSERGECDANEPIKTEKSEAVQKAGEDKALRLITAAKEKAQKETEIFISKLAAVNDPLAGSASCSLTHFHDVQVWCPRCRDSKKIGDYTPYKRKTRIEKFHAKRLARNLRELQTRQAACPAGIDPKFELFPTPIAVNSPQSQRLPASVIKQNHDSISSGLQFPSQAGIAGYAPGNSLGTNVEEKGVGTGGWPSPPITPHPLSFTEGGKNLALDSALPPFDLMVGGGRLAVPPPVVPPLSSEAQKQALPSLQLIQNLESRVMQIAACKGILIKERAKVQQLISYIIVCKQQSATGNDVFESNSTLVPLLAWRLEQMLVMTCTSKEDYTTNIDLNVLQGRLKLLQDKIRSHLLPKQEPHTNSLQQHDALQHQSAVQLQQSLFQLPPSLLEQQTPFYPQLHHPGIPLKTHQSTLQHRQAVLQPPGSLQPNQSALYHTQTNPLHQNTVPQQQPVYPQLKQLVNPQQHVVLPLLQQNPSHVQHNPSLAQQQQVLQKHHQLAFQSMQPPPSQPNPVFQNPTGRMPTTQGSLGLANISIPDKIHTGSSRQGISVSSTSGTTFLENQTIPQQRRRRSGSFGALPSEQHSQRSPQTASWGMLYQPFQQNDASLSVCVAEAKGFSRVEAEAKQQPEEKFQGMMLYQEEKQQPPPREMFLPSPMQLKDHIAAPKTQSQAPSSLQTLPVSPSPDLFGMPSLGYSYLQRQSSPPARMHPPLQSQLDFLNQGCEMPSRKRMPVSSPNSGLDAPNPKQHRHSRCVSLSKVSPLKENFFGQGSKEMLHLKGKLTKDRGKKIKIRSILSKSGTEDSTTDMFTVEVASCRTTLQGSVSYLIITASAFRSHMLERTLQEFLELSVRLNRAGFKSELLPPSAAPDSTSYVAVMNQYLHQLLDEKGAMKNRDVRVFLGCDWLDRSLSSKKGVCEKEMLSESQQMLLNGLQLAVRGGKVTQGDCTSLQQMIRSGDQRKISEAARQVEDILSRQFG